MNITLLHTDNCTKADLDAHITKHFPTDRHRIAIDKNYGYDRWLKHIENGCNISKIALIRPLYKDDPDQLSILESFETKFVDILTHIRDQSLIHLDIVILDAKYKKFEIIPLVELIDHSDYRSYIDLSRMEEMAKDNFNFRMNRLRGWHISGHTKIQNMGVGTLKMDSREIYEKETGKNPIYYNGTNDEFTKDYLNWLERNVF